MKKTITLLLIALAPFNFFAQTDVTSLLIDNPDFENGTTGWNFFATNSPTDNEATFAVESGVGSNGSNGAEFDVITASGNFNQVVFRNLGVDNSVDWSGQVITLSARVRSLNSSTFRFRLVSTTANGNVFSASADKNSTSTYQEFSMAPYTVPDNTSQITIQIMCGSTADTYYFDDFSANIEGSLSVDDNRLINDFTAYPNPATDIVNIKTNRQISNISIIDLLGRVKLVSKSQDNININALSSGQYILCVNFEDGDSVHKKIIKN